MAMTEERALEILQELIKKPESKAEDVPRVWSEILGVYRQAFATPEVPVKKKRRRRSANGGNPSLQGWPKGLTRAAYSAWKESLPANYEGAVNPQAYMRQRDASKTEQQTPPAPAKAPKALAVSQPKKVAGSKSTR